MRDAKLYIRGTAVEVWEKNVNEPEFSAAVYGPIIRYLRARGFNVRKDPDTKKHYPSLQNRRHCAKKGDLEAYLECSGRCVKVEFFQSIVIENSHGGRYDFDKYEKMPYLVQKAFLLEAGLLCKWLEKEYGYTDGPGNTQGWQHVLTCLVGIDPVSDPLRRFNDMWEANRFVRDETGWPVPKEYDHGSNRDREGVPLRNGMFRYFRDRSGYLKRGVIYTNMNCMWQVVYGPGRQDTTWVSCWQLFTLQPEDNLRREIPKEKREARLKQELTNAVNAMWFERAAVLRDIISGEVYCAEAC